MEIYFYRWSFSNDSTTKYFNFDQYQESYVSRTQYFDSGADCNDNDPSLTGEDKDGDGSTCVMVIVMILDPQCIWCRFDRDERFSECGGDCDDNDPFDMLDRDGDGFCTGDCNDYDLWTHPRFIEWVQDDVDQNCDNTDQIIAVSAVYITVVNWTEGYISWCWGEQFVMNTPTTNGFIMIHSSDNATIALDSNGDIQMLGKSL